MTKEQLLNGVELKKLKKAELLEYATNLQEMFSDMEDTSWVQEIADIRALESMVGDSAYEVMESLASGYYELSPIASAGFKEDFQGNYNKHMDSHDMGLGFVNDNHMKECMELVDIIMEKLPNNLYAYERAQYVRDNLVLKSENNSISPIMIEDLECSLATAENEGKELTGKLEKLEARNLVLESQNKELISENSNLWADFNRLEEMLFLDCDTNEMTFERMDLVNKLGRYKDNNKALKAMLERANDDNKTLSHKLEQLELKVDKKDLYIRGLENKIKVLENGTRFPKKEVETSVELAHIPIPVAELQDNSTPLLENISKHTIITVDALLVKRKMRAKRLKTASIKTKKGIKDTKNISLTAENGVISVENSVNDTILQELKPNNVVQLVQKPAFKTVDKRNKGGALWVIADSSQTWLKELGFTFSPKGGRATKGSSAWWTNKPDVKLEEILSKAV